MSQNLQSKRVLVTGGSKGIGFEVAKALLGAGAHVAICGRTQSDLDRASAALGTVGPKLVVKVADVSNPSDVEALFHTVESELGGLDILINNAGVGVFKPAAELSVEEWNRVIGVNLSGAFYCTRLAVKHFAGNDAGGFIVNISSLAGKNAFAGGSAYNASKFGLNGFSEATMLDHRSEKVRVSYVMPGSVDTGFGGQETGSKSEWKIAPEDVAEIVLGILRMPERTLISRVEVRPSRPQKN